MQIYDWVFPAYVLGYTLILSSTYVLSFFDMIIRIITCDTCGDEDPIIQEFTNDTELQCVGVTCATEEAYVRMDDSDNVVDNTGNTDESDHYHKVEETDSVVADVRTGSINEADGTSKET
jgi:hypothetical protein